MPTLMTAKEITMKIIMVMPLMMSKTPRRLSTADCNYNDNDNDNDDG